MTAEHEYDIIVAGAGISGLWLAARLRRAGYNVIVADEADIGGVQTLASQGMIHGGQKYVLPGGGDLAARTASIMPERWEKCFAGYGDLDLTSVKFTSEEQVMWPAGSVVAEAAVFAAAKAVNAGTEKMKPADWPAPLAAMRGKKKFTGGVYRLPEKVLDIRTLAAALSEPLKGRIFRAKVENPQPDGFVAVGGRKMRAQAVIFAAGKGNEQVFADMKVETRHTQRRPLRQVMVKTMDETLNGHGVVAHPKPRATITSHPLSTGGYVWYFGGNIAEKGASMTEEETIRFAKSEMEEMFPLINWEGREWATWAGDRAEPVDAKGHLPPGPHIHQRGQVLVAWTVKLTYAPLLADLVLDWLNTREIKPLLKTAPPDLTLNTLGKFPWETAKWVKIDGKAA